MEIRLLASRRVLRTHWLDKAEPMECSERGEIKGAPREQVEKVSRIFASWNQLDGWLRQVERLRHAA